MDRWDGKEKRDSKKEEFNRKIGKILFFGGLTLMVIYIADIISDDLISGCLEWGCPP